MAPSEENIQFSTFMIKINWSPTLTVIYDAFLVENEMESVTEILTLTWTELGIFDESSLFPSLSPSLNYVLVKFPSSPVREVQV